MARPPSAPGGRPIIVRVRLSEQEAATLDKRRGSTSRSAYLRSPLGKVASSDDLNSRPIQTPVPSPIPDPYQHAPDTGAAAVLRPPCVHQWKRLNNLMDRCTICGKERGHVLGVH